MPNPLSRRLSPERVKHHPADVGTSLGMTPEVSNFAQTALAKEGTRYWDVGHGSVAICSKNRSVSTKEAMPSACDAKTDKNKEGPLELAPTWTPAASQ